MRFKLHRDLIYKITKGTLSLVLQNAKPNPLESRGLSNSLENFPLQYK